MAVEERIVETETPSGNTHTTHTVVDTGARSGGGSGWLIAIILLLAIVVGGYFLMQGTNASANKDNAIAAAADDVRPRLHPLPADRERVHAAAE